MGGTTAMTTTAAPKVLATPCDELDVTVGIVWLRGNQRLVDNDECDLPG